MTFFVTANGQSARSCRLIVPWTGVPTAELRFATAQPTPAGPVALQVGSLALTCAFDASQSGDFALSSSWTLLGGAGGWRKALPAKGTHNDATVRKSVVAVDVAGSVGETVSVDPSADAPIGADHLRSADTASAALEQLFPGVAWWVSPDGTTHVGQRPTRDVTGLVSIVGEADPRLGVAQLVADDPTNLLPGCFFTDSRLGLFQIHDLDLNIDATSARGTVYASPRRDPALLDLLALAAARANPRAIYAFPHEYRVVTLSSNRVNIQYVPDQISPIPQDFPDALTISVSPGMAGLFATLTPGARVLVTFIAGNPGRPVITHFAPKDDPGFLPVELTVDASSAVHVGPSATGACDVCSSAAALTVGGVDPANPGTSPGHFVRYGDVIINTGASGPMPIVMDPSCPTMARAKA